MYSAYKLNKQGDNIQPWCTPFPVWNQSVVPCPVLTIASWPATCQCRRHKGLGFNPWVGKIPWRQQWQPTPVFLPGKFHGQRSWAGYTPRGCKELDITEYTHIHYSHTCMSDLKLTYLHVRLKKKRLWMINKWLHKKIPWGSVEQWCPRPMIHKNLHDLWPNTYMCFLDILHPREIITHIPKDTYRKC